MSETFKVPIRNIFCLLSYANDMPDLVKHFSDLDEDIITFDFLAKRFNQEVEKILRRGLLRNYVTTVEATNRLGGRMLINESISLIMERKPLAVCEKDEYSSDILFNQIVKTTLEHIYRNKQVNESVRKKSYMLWEQLPEVSSIRLTKEIFIRITFNRLNQNYKPVIHLAKLFHECKLLTHKSGNWNLFTVELNDTALNSLFEKFLLRFYQLEQNQYKVRSERLNWNLNGNPLFLPTMQTDVSMQHKYKCKKIIIDAKFYKNIFQENFGKSTFHSGNMYQLFTYLMHQPDNLVVKGILVYPDNGYEVKETFHWDGRLSMEVMSINLDDSWMDIYHRLLEIVSEDNNY